MPAPRFDQRKTKRFSPRATALDVLMIIALEVLGLISLDKLMAIRWNLQAIKLADQAQPPRRRPRLRRCHR